MQRALSTQTFVLTFALALAAPASPLMAQFGWTRPDATGITVTAQSELMAEPDEVILNFAVVTFNEQLPPAKQENDRLSRNVIALRDKYRISHENFSVSDVSLRPKYNSSGYNRPQDLIGYHFVRQFKVTFREVEQIDAFIDDALQSGVSYIGSLDFRLSNQRQQQFEARKLAVTYAREKATHLAELTGVKVGKPLAIQESVEFYYDENVGGFGGFGGISAAPAKDPRKAEPATEPVVDANGTIVRAKLHYIAQQDDADAVQQQLLIPRKIKLRATVTIRYEIDGASQE